MDKIQDEIKRIKCMLQEVRLVRTQDTARFFKQGPGQYAEHDQFLGIKVPDLRKIARLHSHADQEVIELLLHSVYNEERLLALMILIHQYQKASALQQKQLCHFYLEHKAQINNWNLVDASAHWILGHYLWDKERTLLWDMARAPSLWERRIAIVATWFFIRSGDIDTTLQIARILWADKEDLIHKATGWMLREAGKKQEQVLVQFLAQHREQLAKTTFRYATEKLTTQQKDYIINGKH